MYYKKHREQLCATRRNKYRLAQPKPHVRDQYMKELKQNLVGDYDARVKVVKIFKKRFETGLPKLVSKTACRIAATRLVNKALQVRKRQVGCLLKTTRTIQRMDINGLNDFGEACHTESSEPYFYDSAYLPVKRASPIPVE